MLYDSSVVDILLKIISITIPFYSVIPRLKRPLEAPLTSNASKCISTFFVCIGGIMRFLIKGTFFTSSERNTFSLPCSNDYVEIADENNVMVGYWCGYFTGEKFSVGGEFAEITFSSDSQYHYRGFRMKFSTVEPSKCEKIAIGYYPPLDVHKTEGASWYQ